MDVKERIAKRIALELKPGDLVNLGIGIPTLVSNYLSDPEAIYLQSENGIIGLGPLDETETECVNAGGKGASILAGGSYFDTATSFMLIRGGHVDVTVLGALEVDESGSLASWIVPGKLVPGMGGAMDLVTGAKKVIIATLHTNNGIPKIVKQCSLPLTAYGVVDVIVTEMAVIAVTPLGLKLEEVHSDYTIEQVINATEASLIIDDVKTMKGE